jgi:hypothetical protein
VQPLHRAYGGYTFEREGIGGDVRGDAVAFGDGDDAPDALFKRITRLVALRSL